MNPGAALIWIVGAFAAIVMAAMLFVRLPGDEPAAKSAPVIASVPEFSRKPCPYCEASSIRVAPSTYLNRCQVCGCEFRSAD